VLNCALKVFPFILVIFVYVNLKKKNKKKNKFISSISEFFSAEFQIWSCDRAHKPDSSTEAVVQC
jgi:hypothetical protein